MKLAISNIAWEAEDDRAVFEEMGKLGFSGLEIAPTRIVPNPPYQHLKQANEYKNKLKAEFDLSICSMQSLWFGRTENIFKSESDRQILIDYTKKAIDFAAELQCPNLVFGSPRNRNIENSKTLSYAYSFFESIAEYAIKKRTVVALEPNPAIYNTNFLNNMSETANFVNELGSEGLLINFDFGSFIENNESIADLAQYIGIIHHVHISEPHLKPIVQRDEHLQLYRLLKDHNYQGFVSIEMRNQPKEDIFTIMKYVSNVFRGA